MRSAATSEFDEDFGHSEQMGFDDMDIDNDADEENLDNDKSNRKVLSSSPITHYNDTYCHQLNL